MKTSDSFMTLESKEELLKQALSGTVYRTREDYWRALENLQNSLNEEFASFFSSCKRFNSHILAQPFGIQILNEANTDEKTAEVLA